MGRPFQEQPPKQDKSLRYPLNELNKSSDFLRIGIINYVAPGLGSKDVDEKQFYKDAKGKFVEITDKNPKPTTVTAPTIKSEITKFEAGRKNRKTT